ncbi:MAG: fructose-1,6-bisphosphatase [Lachnospiraceae bacterium]|nr:fructose-1,6-bisphosphatase [Lachnospiraceae bacterium]
MDLRYLRVLARRFPTISKASTEIINLSAILNLPKGTEHFVSDLHGEYEQFLHVLKNGSGSIKQKIEEEFGNTLSEKDKRTLATLIYYPEQKLALIEKQEREICDWYKITLNRLIKVTCRIASKYTRSRVRKMLSSDFAYIFEEIIFENDVNHDKDAYYNSIISTIIQIGRAPACIIALCQTIQRLAVSHLHVLGDIYDRGPGPHIIMDTLMNYHSVDIQWGNHDITWMAAASGHPACIAVVLRFAARYGELDIVEDGYGINLVPLLRFVMDTYKDNPGPNFNIHYNKATYNELDLEADKRIQKAMAIIQFKLEGQIIQKHPEFHMEDRLLLDKINYEDRTILLDGVTYPLNDTDFPTIDPADPYRLTPEEENVMERLVTAFTHSEKLNRHVRFLYEKGSLYLIYNNNLLYHGCVPFNEDGEFINVQVGSKSLHGKCLYDELDKFCRKAFYLPPGPEKSFAQDIMWFIWCNKNSPLFGKEKMATFERYFIDDESTWVESKNPYYSLLENEEIVNKILIAFELDPENSRIINGHVPVKNKENPVKCNGKLMIIDGGFSKAYQKTTGIAGYTLIYNSNSIFLAAHKPFTSTEEAIQNEDDIHSEHITVRRFAHRRLVKDMDNGLLLQEQIADLTELLQAFRQGLIRESSD